MGHSRRDFIRFIVASSALGAIPKLSESAEPISTIDSEDFSILHRLRDGEGFPAPSRQEQHNLVIVGGGISGLTAAYRTGEGDVLLLEKERQLGGNSRSSVFRDATCSIGAAYVYRDTVEGKMAAELGLDLSTINSWDGTVDNGVHVTDTWGDGLKSLPYRREAIQQFADCREKLAAIEVSPVHDDIPLSNLIEPYGPEVNRWWLAFCRSTWGGAPTEIAASLPIEELKTWTQPDRNDVRTTWSGGVGALAQKLSERVRARRGVRVADGATVLSVSNHPTHVEVLYWRDGLVTRVTAKAAIVATPQLVTSRIVADLPKQQVNAMRQFRYNPYCVVNLVFDRPVKRLGYDTWFPGRAFTDVVAADWMDRDRPSAGRPKHQIMTCYVPLTPEFRSELLTIEGCRGLATRVLDQFQRSLPDYQVDPVEVHLYRRGHAIHTSMPGLRPLQMAARAPFGRVAFANTDISSMSSSTEGAINAANRALAEVDPFI